MLFKANYFIENSMIPKKQVHAVNVQIRFYLLVEQITLDFVCESLACLNNPTFSFSFDVVGNYPLQNKKAHKTIAGRIKFHTHVDRQLSQYYQDAALTIVASHKACN